MKSTKLVALMMALSLFACRSGGNDDDDDGDDAGDDGSADDIAIQDIQSDDMPVGTPVTMRDVVVVAVDAFGQDQGKLFVMEPEGGPFSGVLVFLEGSEAAGLVPGDLVDVVGGEKDEYAFEEDTRGTITEIVAPEGGSIAVTKTGDGEVPEPTTLLPWELAADEYADSEQWEGVLVRFENVRVHEALDQIDDDDPTRLATEVTGPFNIQSDLTSFDGVEPGNCYASITGIGDYFFNYKILPRSADDLVAGDDADCLPAETSDELCGDGVDNDYNGYADCEDFSCADAAVACPTTETSIADIQAGEIAVDTVVTLSQVIVTGVSFDRPDGNLQNRTFWVQDAAVASENSGVAVFWPEDDAGELPEEIVVGRTLDLQATVDEFPCVNGAPCPDTPVTQLGFAMVRDFGALVPVEDLLPLEGLDIATLATDPDNEPYEGMLVRLENVEVANEALGTNDFTVGDGTVELVIDDVIFRYREDNEVAAGQCFTSIVGIVHRDIFGDYDNVPVLLPRSLEDVDATPGACL
jgi:hypothetical protein